ncbi:MAG: hypothetical protein RJA35_900, partial [Actinomycetota bacterium]
MSQNAFSLGDFAPVSFEADIFDMRALATMLLSAGALTEAAVAAHGARPATLIASAVLLTPIAVDIMNLAQRVSAAACHYESTDSGLIPQMIQMVDQVVTEVAGAAAQVGSVLTAPSAATVASLGLGVLTAFGAGETPVDVSAKALDPISAPKDVNAMLKVLNRAAEARQILVQTVETQGVRDFTIYLPGTNYFDRARDKNPFDLTSDFAAMTRTGTAGSEMSAIQALKDSGFGKQPGDRVTVVGHSQGALIGANLVSSGEITKLGGTVRGLVSVAGPIGVRNLPPEVKVLSIEAKNDLVPKLDLANVPTTS